MADEEFFVYPHSLRSTSDRVSGMGSAVHEVALGVADLSAWVPGGDDPVSGRIRDGLGPVFEKLSGDFRALGDFLHHLGLGGIDSADAFEQSDNA